MTSGLPFSLEVNHACKYKKKRGNPRHHILFLSLDGRKASSVHGSDMQEYTFNGLPQVSLLVLAYISLPVFGPAT